MSDDNNRVVIMAWPMSWPQVEDIPGTVTVTAHCGHDVRQAPSTREMLAKRPDIDFKCIPCVVASDPDILSKMAITDEQRSELNGFLGVGETDQVMARLGFKQLEL